MKKVLIWCGVGVFVIGIAFTIFYNTPDRRAKRQAQQIIKVSEYIYEEMQGSVGEAKITTARVQIQNLETALRLFYLDTGFYPTTEQGLWALVIPPPPPFPFEKCRKGGYLEKDVAGYGAVPEDPWGNDYIYRSPGQEKREYEIICLGWDGKEGGTGVDADIKSWEPPK
ncbi:MAG: type II secretion system major pseudopilin GspG [Candidatus Omnitrophota bacterium]